MIDLDRLSNILQSDDVIYAEVVTYSLGKDGKMVRTTTHINYHEDDDYQWSTSVKPLFKE